MPKDDFGKAWIIENSLEVLAEYSDVITIRQLYYRLVARGMTNDLNHYKRVVSAMTARWVGDIEFEAFINRQRSTFGETKATPVELDAEIDKGKQQVKAWMEAYHLHRWENQPEYVEVWIEKKALQGVFEHPCSMYDVGLAPCKGYPSLTFLNEAHDRFADAESRGQNVIIIYFGDYDPSGEDIPRSIEKNISRMGSDVEIERIALLPQQIEEMGLPSAPAKATDSRSRTWEGEGVVELDAVEPRTLTRMGEEAIKRHFDESLYVGLQEREEGERESYQMALKEFVNELEE